MRVKRETEPADDWRLGVVSLLLSGVIRALGATVDLRFHGETPIRQLEASRSPFILGFWHRHLVLMRFAYRGHRMHVLTSQSRDGELTAQTLDRLGIASVRGSSSRGGALALREMLRLGRKGSDLAFTPDGPRGPRGSVQPGIVATAASTGLPVIPVAIAANRRRLLRTWDAMVVPWPGSRVEIVYGELLHFERGVDMATGAERLRLALEQVERRAETLAGQSS